MNITDTTMRYVVASIVLVLLVGLIYTSSSGKKQDEKFATEQATYNQALQYVQEGQYDQALPLLQQVEKEQADSVPVKYYTGLTFANSGDWAGAVKVFKQVLDLNPYKVEDSMFMLQFAEILVYAEKKDEAKIVLERCKTLPVPAEMPEYQTHIQTLLTQISASS